MIQDDYKKEMEQMKLSEAQMRRLRRAMAQPASRPRRLTRRAVAVLAVCAALLIGALAAGPTIWQEFQARQGPFAGIAQTIDGAVCADQGIEIQVLSALADDVRGEVYFTVRDTAGDRLDDQLTLHRAEGGDLNGRLVKYDPERRTALFIATLRYDRPMTSGAVSIAGLDDMETGRPLRLAVDGMTTRQGALEAGASCAGITDALLDSLPLGKDDRVVMKIEESGYTADILPAQKVVLAPGQTHVPLEGTGDVSISSMGFASDGRFHVRVAYARGIGHDDITMGYFLARVYPKETDRIGEDKYWLPMVVTQVEGGADVLFPLIRAGEAEDLDQVYFYGGYERPGTDVAGAWTIDFEMERHPSAALDWTGELAGRRVERVTVSPLTVTMDSNDTGGLNSAALCAVLRDGSTVPTQCGIGSYNNVGAGTGAEVWTAYNTWEFERPVDVADIVSLRILGQEIPVSPEP